MDRKPLVAFKSSMRLIYIILCLELSHLSDSTCRGKNLTVPSVCLGESCLIIYTM